MTHQHPFDGQVMECQNCHRQQRSNPHVNSDWNHLEIDGVGFYLCPQCWALGKPTRTFLQWLSANFSNVKGKTDTDDHKPTGGKL